MDCILLTPEQLDPRVTYSVVSDVSMRASVLALGRTIRDAVNSQEFRRFQLHESIWDGYVRVDCGRFCLAVWRDPTRPELRAAVNGPEPAIALQPLLDPEEPTQAATPTSEPFRPFELVAEAVTRELKLLYVQS